MQKPLELKLLHGTYKATRDRGKRPLREIYQGEPVIELKHSKHIRHPRAKEFFKLSAQRLINLKILFPEDLPSFQTHFITLSLAFQELDEIESIRKQMKDIEREMKGLDPEEAEILYSLHTRLSEQLMRKEVLWIKLTNQFQAVQKDFLATPLQKTKMVALYAQGQRDDEEENPILSVLRA